MHELERFVAEWRKTMTRVPNVGRETLDELESHLRENVAQLVRSGMTVPEAFEQAVTQLGSAATIASEFQKLDERSWLPVKVMTGIGFTVAAALVILLIARLDGGRLNLLLASHVFMVTVGYTTTLLIGALGICFVGQRCFSDFSATRVRSLMRVTFMMSCVAGGLTALGIILGMVWAKAEWGRYWAWDPKETGAFAVIVWQTGFLFAHQFARRTPRGVLVMSLLGNIVISLAWFGPHLLSAGLYTYGTRMYSLLLLVTVISNCAFFLIGWAPARWLLPPRKTL